MIMFMKAIIEYTNEEAEVMSNKWKELRDKTKGIPRAELFSNYTRISGPAHYNFSGDIMDKLIEVLGHEPSPDEIIMIVDSGFCNFGACCSIHNRHFSGRVNID